MDQHLKSIIHKRVERTLEGLKKNNMQAVYVERKEQVVDQVREWMKEGDTVTCGGSQSLFEAGVIDYLRSGRYRLMDRYAPGITREQLKEIYIQAFSSDVYVTSSNAITENGELYNVDGNGNRVAAMIFGPKSVIVVAGCNKLVKDIPEAVERVKSTAAPANSTRLDCKTPCVKTGYCMDCKGDNRICRSYVVLGPQKEKNRIKVILVGEELGY